MLYKFCLPRSYPGVVKMAAYVFVAGSVILIPDVENDAFWRFWAESFLVIAQSQLKEDGVYIFDEPDAEILTFDNGKLHTCSYEDTDSYQITEMFINNRKQLLSRLLTD